MPHAPQRSALSGVRVESAMRRQVVRGVRSASLSACINQLIKHKVGAMLVVDGLNRPAGVLSKTDLISAYYAMLPVDTPVGDIVAGAPAFCYPDDLLEDAIDRMQAEGIHRIYVRGAHIEQIVGTLSYLDVVGLLYRYCRNCRNSLFRHRQGDALRVRRLQVGEVMSPRLHTGRCTGNLGEIIETLTSSRCGAALLVDHAAEPVGVISKTDLVLAYKHGLAIETTAAEIMQQPVLSCGADDLLAHALQQMLLRDVQRLFVHQGNEHRIVGVLSLSDSARFRSGSCRACIPSRLLADDPSRS